MVLLMLDKVLLYQFIMHIRTITYTSSNLRFTVYLVKAQWFHHSRLMKNFGGPPKKHLAKFVIGQFFKALSDR